MVPDIAERLISSGWQVALESGAGAAAAFPDEAYRAVGVSLAADRRTLLAGAEVVLTVNSLDETAADLVAEGATTLSFLQPTQAAASLGILAAKRATVLSFDFVPRISRAQSMDALSSQATVSGYRAGLLGAERLAKFFPMFMTAAGTAPPPSASGGGGGGGGLPPPPPPGRRGGGARVKPGGGRTREGRESRG